MYVFRLSISFFKNAAFLAISFSMIEIVRWSVSMTSSSSASDLLKFFASLVSAVFVDTIGDMLVDQIFTLLNDSLLLTTVNFCFG